MLTKFVLIICIASSADYTSGCTLTMQEFDNELACQNAREAIIYDIPWIHYHNCLPKFMEIPTEKT